MLACGAIVGLAVASGAWWLLSPAERVFVVVSPVVDQTGRPEVSPYRLALTQSLITRLSESRDVRPVSYRRLLQTLRRFSGDSSREVFSRDAVQAVASDTGAALIIIPTFWYEGNAWRARVRVPESRSDQRRNEGNRIVRVGDQQRGRLRNWFHRLRHSLKTDSSRDSRASSMRFEVSSAHLGRRASPICVPWTPPTRSRRVSAPTRCSG